MKTSLVLAFMLTTVSAQAAQLAPADSFTKIEFFGLSCTVCEDGLKAKFESLLPGGKALVDMSALTVCLQHKPGFSLSATVIKDTLASIGFDTVKVQSVAKC